MRVGQTRTPAVHLRVKQSEVEGTAAYFPLFFPQHLFIFSSWWYQKGVSLSIAPVPNEYGPLKHCARFAFPSRAID